MSDRGKGRSRGLRPWHVILGIVLLLVAAVSIWFFIQANRARSGLQALRAQGQPTSYNEWKQLYQVPPGTENAAELYMMASRAYYKPDHDAELPYVGKTKLPPLGEPIPATMVEAMEAFLKQNEQVLELLRKARGIEQCHYDWDPLGEMPDLKMVRSSAQLLVTAAMLKAHQGDTEAALAYIEDALATARSVRNEAGLVCYLVRQSCTAISIHALERALNTTTFTEKQLVKADRLLTEAMSTMDLTKAWIGERCGLIECIEDPSRSGSLNGAAMIIPGLRDVGMADMLDYMGDCIEASKLPPMERTTRIKEIFDGLNDLSGIHIVAKIVAPALGRIAEIDTRCRMNVTTAHIALAVERYRLATGQLPEDLGALVPKYLDRVPVDFYDGQPIRYRRTEPGYILYSIGEDKQDNEGKSREQVDRQEPYDWPFVVTK